MMTLLSRIARVIFLAALVVAFMEGDARSYTPPPLGGAVTDTASALSPAEKKELESRLAAYRSRTTNEIVVFLLPSLGGEAIEDVAYGAFNAWKVGKQGKDNGVLLVIAMNDHKMRMETGKGIGDRLTDIQSSQIDRERIAPLLRKGRTHDAVAAGIEGIEAALDGRPASPLASASVSAPSAAETAFKPPPLDGGP